MDIDLQKVNVDEIRANKRLRQTLAYEDPLWFSLLYLRHHFSHPFAPFHLEMFHLIRGDCDFMAVMAFRESGKSTILSTAHALWSILGKPQKRFVLMIGKTQEQAKNHFANIKQELQTNELLQEDFGPFTEGTDEWNKLSLELEYQGSKILALGRDQSVRGLKYGSYRPDLIICDDLEDTQARTPAERQAMYKWFQQEVQPLGSAGTRIVVLGNYLFADSLLLQLRTDILEGRTQGIFRAYPLLDDDGRCLWKERYPTKRSIRALRSQFNGNAWASEYLLVPHSSDSDWDNTITKDTDPFRKQFILLSRKYEKHFAVLYKKYEVLIPSSPQVSLIKQMARYQISAPVIPRMIEPGEGDPLYQTRKEFKREMDAIMKLFDNDMKALYISTPQRG